VAPPPTPKEQADDESFLQRVQRKVQRFKDGITAGVRSREDRAGDIARWASDGRTCNEAIHNADVWLSEPVPRGESFTLRRSVMKAKVQCLQYQGRSGDAQAVQKELERL
jgi:hypothetical protein